MKVGVVGGTGNISTSVVHLLLERGHDVSCITRGLRPGLPDGARPLVGDRDDEAWFVPAVRKQRFDAVIDFVCYTPDQGRVSLEAFRGVGHVVHTSTVVTIGEEFDELPVTEHHPLRATMPYGIRKAEIDQLYLVAHTSENFPVTIIKPSTTYGRQRVVRQIGVDTRWISRIIQGRPIIKVGDGNAIHHLLHVDDAAIAFVGVLERSHCIGETYLLVNPEHTDWNTVHRTAMKVLGRHVDQVGVPTDVLVELDPARFEMAKGIFAHNLFYSAQKLQQDVPEFRPRISLAEGLADAFTFLLEHGLVEPVPRGDWEDRIIAAQRSVVRSATAPS
ncbi:hypothetical protein PROP_00574 [Propionicimonas sp. T2.31MG-18]|uniref:NAD-dependent epimerase/dehydratase family protein n=1 Tax=Propionicimonas sp. T2.31MG-18 TaxID=3157620 RepID=UPI0035E786D7